MRSSVTVVFSPRQSLELDVDVDVDQTAAKAAHEWFDDTWTRLGCEPLRPSGKVLLLDKIMGVADALGYSTLSQDTQRANEFARQAVTALGRTRITIDLPGQTVAY